MIGDYISPEENQDTSVDKNENLEERVMHLLRTAREGYPCGYTEGELAEKLDVHRNKLRMVFDFLERKGKIDRTKIRDVYHYYCLPPGYVSEEKAEEKSFKFLWDDEESLSNKSIGELLFAKPILGYWVPANFGSFALISVNVNVWELLKHLKDYVSKDEYEEFKTRTKNYLEDFSFSEIIPLNPEDPIINFSEKETQNKLRDFFLKKIENEDFSRVVPKRYMPEKDELERRIKEMDLENSTTPNDLEEAQRSYLRRSIFNVRLEDELFGEGDSSQENLKNAKFLRKVASDHPDVFAKGFFNFFLFTKPLPEDKSELKEFLTEIGDWYGEWQDLEVIDWEMSDCKWGYGWEYQDGRRIPGLGIQLRHFRIDLSETIDSFEQDINRFIEPVKEYLAYMPEKDMNRFGRYGIYSTEKCLICGSTSDESLGKPINLGQPPMFCSNCSENFLQS